MVRNKKFRSGLTMIELVTTMAISLILMLVVGILLVSSAQGWQQNYDKAHKQIKQNANEVMLAFETIGRMANRGDYRIFNVVGNNYTVATSGTPNVETVVSGSAVEFRYWDVALDSTDSHNLMDVSKTATAYAFFYFQNGSLKVDYGHLPPGAVPAAGGARNTANIKTVVLAQNAAPGPGCGAFSHTMISGVGKGSVRINIVLTDPQDNQQIRIANSVLIRNKWPQ